MKEEEPNSFYSQIKVTVFNLHILFRGFNIIDNFTFLIIMSIIICKMYF
jgi:hypothetical protein